MNRNHDFQVDYSLSRTGIEGQYTLKTSELGMKTSLTKEENKLIQFSSTVGANCHQPVSYSTLWPCRWCKQQYFTSRFPDATKIFRLFLSVVYGNFTSSKTGNRNVKKICLKLLNERKPFSDITALSEVPHWIQILLSLWSLRNFWF